jgi:hypothetical protein
MTAAPAGTRYVPRCGIALGADPLEAASQRIADEISLATGFPIVAIER